MQLVEPSIYAPRPGCDPVEPAWKGFADFKDYVHPRQPTARRTVEYLMPSRKLLVRGGQVYDHDGDVHKPKIADILIEDGDIVARRRQGSPPTAPRSSTRAASSSSPA